MMLKILLALLAPAPSPGVEKDLCARSYKVRKAAHQKLEKLSLSQLRWMQSRAKCGESRHRIRTQMQRAKRKQLKAWEPYPMIDAWWYDEVSGYYRREHPLGCRWGHYLDRCLEMDLHSKWTLFPSYREATRLWAEDRLDEGWPAWWIEQLLLAMHRTDAKWIASSYHSQHREMPFTQMRVPYGPRIMPKAGGAP